MKLGTDTLVNATATFETTVTDKNASFHYCTVGSHCASGMFGVINPPKDNATATAPSATVTGGVMDGWISNWSQSVSTASGVPAGTKN